MTHSRQSIHALLGSYGVSPTKAMGQNFVADPNTVRRIARLAGVGTGDHVVEVGGGLGSLTLALLETGASLTVVEFDSALVEALRSMLEGTTARLVHADAMTLDWEELLAGASAWSLVANLPYNIATPLVLDVLDRCIVVQRMLVMVQREVGERLVASPGSRTYGIPSVKVAYHAEARIVGAVPASVFVPRPTVASVLVEIRRRQQPAVDVDPEVLFTLVRTAFGQRRKMLRRSLGDLVAPAVFERAGIDPTARPEQLDVAAWGRLVDALGTR